jgi:hypothetical protein
MIEVFVTDSVEALAAISTESEKNVWINGSQTVISTGEDYVAPVEVVTFLDVVAEEVVVKATVVTKKTAKVVPVEVVADTVAPVVVPVEVVEPV